MDQEEANLAEPNSDGSSQKSDDTRSKGRRYLAQIKENKWATTVAALSMVAIVSVGISAANPSSNTLGGIELKGEFAAAADEVGELDVVIEGGYSFALGAPATDTTNYDEYKLPDVPAELNARLIDAVNTSPAFEHIGHINELLQYDDFDNNGNIKIEVINSLLEIAESAE